MENKTLEKRKEIFQKELEKLIEDFSVKRKKYYANLLKFSWVIVILNAGISFSVGISFIDEIALEFKIVSLLLSSILLIFNGAMGFLNYRKLYEQRTRTLVKLLDLKREYCFKVQYSESDLIFDEICSKLQAIMLEDLDTWNMNFPKEMEMR